MPLAATGVGTVTPIDASGSKSTEEPLQPPDPTVKVGERADNIYCAARAHTDRYKHQLRIPGLVLVNKDCATGTRKIKIARMSSFSVHSIAAQH